MKEQIKAYCLEELRNIQHNWDADRAISRAYGAVMFYTNYAKNEPEEDRNEIRTWWEEKMLYSMLKLREEIKQKRKEEE
jgi:hypothetical protein